MRNFWRAMSVGLVITVVAGCSSHPGPSSRVSGAVRYKGEPLKGGTIRFVTDQGPYSTFIKPDGTYQFVDIPAGVTKVAIETSSISPEKVKKTPKYGGARGDSARDKQMAQYDAMVGKGEMAKKDDKEDLTRFYVKIPAKYEKEETSGLTFTVESGRQTKDFDLTD